MTGSRWVDIAIVLVALIAATSGWRQGAVASALAFVGVILGAVAGILLAPHLLVHVTEGKLRILAGISLIVVLVIIGEVAGMVLGRAARSGMHSPTARSVDSVIGAGLQAVAVVVAAWLLAIPLSRILPPLFVVRTFSPAWTKWRRSGCAASRPSSRRCSTPPACLTSSARSGARPSPRSKHPTRAFSPVRWRRSCVRVFSASTASHRVASARSRDPDSSSPPNAS